MGTEEKDYSKTVNLPVTGFDMKANLPQREPEFIKFWESIDIYGQLRKTRKGAAKFILHDGPPYANGHLHLGHALNKILKDFIVKQKSMKGFDAPYTPGWDCHGLPIEQAALKEMKLDKNSVDKVKFRKQAADFAKKFVAIQRDEFKRLGVFADWEKPYLTLDHTYEGIIAKVFGDLAKAGYIYRQKKPVYWCPSCETALAEAEVEYADHVSHSVYVKFKVVSTTLKLATEPAPSVLIWTTTPWTLPANVALAFHPDFEYVNALITAQDGHVENLILAKRLLPVIAEKIGAKEYTVVGEFKGKDLEGIRCANPLVERESVGILADYVTLEDGSGVVHIAPGHGQEDYIAALKYKLPIISPVNHYGAYTDEYPDMKGTKVFAATPLIVEKLKALGALLDEYKFTHSYPHCWRCKKPIIFRATPQWFMSVTHDNLRQRLIEAVKQVKWVPDYGANRIGAMVENRPDWCLSRQRLWGVPVPVLYCEDCGEPVLDNTVISHIVQLFTDHGVDIWYEKTANELAAGLNIKCSKCGSANLRKEEDILDVWFDSGVSYEAVLASGNFPDLSLPADLYLEGSDQHRGWFQTSLLPSVALRGKAPYRTVLTHGFFVDGEGKKMSKSLGNVVAPEAIIKQYGADILRLWTASSDYREDMRISPEIIKGLTDSYRKIRNTVRFLLGNISDFDPSKDALKYVELREIDRYALHLLQGLIKEVNEAFDTYEFHRAATAINRFCTVDLSGFYLDALKDTLYCDGKTWPSRRSAQTALLEICSVLVRLSAPILSHTAEEAWQELKKLDASLPLSVFLADYPKTDESRLYTEISLLRWQTLMQMREQALGMNEILRREKLIGSNLDARMSVAIVGNEDFSHKDMEQLHYALGTFDIVVDKNAVETKVLVSEPSPLKKCVRCWRHISDVGEHGLCGRCTKAVAE